MTQVSATAARTWGTQDPLHTHEGNQRHFQVAISLGTMFFVPAPTGTCRTGILLGHKTSARLLVTFLLICAACSAQTPRYTPSFQKFVEGNNRFAFKYVQLRQQRDSNENLLIAPASLSVAFGLLQNGADAETNQEIGKV